MVQPGRATDRARPTLLRDTGAGRPFIFRGARTEAHRWRCGGLAELQRLKPPHQNRFCL